VALFGEPRLAVAFTITTPAASSLNPRSNLHCLGPHYAASKAGLFGLTHSYAALLAKEGVTANAIAPALISTDMITSNPNASPDRLPVGFFGSPRGNRPRRRPPR
jgi:NAD(P)-dependent dehydrogenase (short-subunit alcohol dehydrogenase family)